MKDMVPKATGNSRLLRSSIPADITHEQLVNMLRAGEFPVDFAGKNSEGIAIEGTPLNKMSLLQDIVALSLHLTDTDNATVNSAIVSLLVEAAADAFGYTNPSFKDTTRFNQLCGLMGIPVKDTWANTCADATAKNAIIATGSLVPVIINTPRLAASFGSIPFTATNIRNSVRGNWYKLWPIGSAVDIPLAAFTFDKSFAAGTYTFELVGIDQDVNTSGMTMPLTLFMRHLHSSQRFFMCVETTESSPSSNSLSKSTIYKQHMNLWNALPNTWRTIVATDVKKAQWTYKGGTVDYSPYSCFLYSEGDFRADPQSEKITDNKRPYQIYIEGKGTPKNLNNGSGAHHRLWTRTQAVYDTDDPYTGWSYGYPSENLYGGSGVLTSNNVNNPCYLCFGFCISPNI